MIVPEGKTSNVLVESVKVLGEIPNVPGFVNSKNSNDPNFLIRT